MRVLYLDIDTLRPDHLGCYGYHRNTSPNLDRIAAQGVRFDRCYASDTPCLPSRSALISGCFGIRNGAINHGGTAADPFLEGRDRGFRSRLASHSWMTALRNAGYRTTSISTFAERHSAMHWYAGFNEVINVGKGGMEHAHEVAPLAVDWLERHGRTDNWFLHVHVWDPHTPYRVPADFGDPFANDPLPAWLTEEVRRQHWSGVGPHSAREVRGYDAEPAPAFPRQPVEARTMADVRQMFDGYDTGILYADHHLGQVLDTLARLGIDDETAIVISSDHGENLGELNIYGDHQLADEITHRLPMIVRWPGVTDAQAGKSLRAFHYHLDVAATIVELCGGKVPASWDGSGFAPALRAGEDVGRSELVLSHGAWSCTRSARFDSYLCMRVYDDGLHCLPEVMLFNVDEDPHEQHDLSGSRPDLVARGLSILEAWHTEAMARSSQSVDPMWTVMREGGPFHTRDCLPDYTARLRQTERSEWAERLGAKRLNGTS
jgi:arylsulfatase A-like enzyme